MKNKEFSCKNCLHWGIKYTSDTQDKSEAKCNELYIRAMSVHGRGEFKIIKRRIKTGKDFYCDKFTLKEGKDD